MNGNEINEQEVFRFLDSIRESGSINMFGASPVIAEMFEVDKREARRLLGAWMKQFGKKESNDV